MEPIYQKQIDDEEVADQAVEHVVERGLGMVMKLVIEETERRMVLEYTVGIIKYGCGVEESGIGALVGSVSNDVVR